MNRLALAALVVAVATAPAYSMSITQRGDTVRLAGTIVMGDEIRFRELVASHAGDLTVDVNSGGGKIAAAKDIARLIRAKGWSVRLDAANSKCASACTVIFAAGSKRIYLNGERLPEGVQGKSGFRGLGYHEGNDPLSLQAGRYSGGATAAMIGMYYELGARAAVDLVTKAPPDKLYRISGPTAVSLGLATSLR